MGWIFGAAFCSSGSLYSDPPIRVPDGAACCRWPLTRCAGTEQTSGPGDQEVCNGQRTSVGLLVVVLHTAAAVRGAALLPPRRRLKAAALGSFVLVAHRQRAKLLLRRRGRHLQRAAPPDAYLRVWGGRRPPWPPLRASSSPSCRDIASLTRTTALPRQNVSRRFHLDSQQLLRRHSKQKLLTQKLARWNMHDGGCQSTGDSRGAQAGAHVAAKAE